MTPCKRVLEFWILLMAFCASALVSCSNNDEEKISGGVSVDEGIATIENKTVAGVSQKGPFVSNTSVKLFGLNKDFIQDGTSYNGKVVSEAGDFSLQRVSLSAPYATLSINGYYRNEVTGKISNSPMELRAITDLSKRSSVNLNLLTHLEYDRVFALLDSEYTFAGAKKQSEREIFGAFFVGEQSTNFENLDIFKQSNQDAALLGISVLLQSSLSEGELTELMAHVSSDIESDGKWDDDTLKTLVADNAFALDLAKVRENIKSWKFGDVPGFETYVEEFWRNVFGLPACGSASEGDTARVKNELSKHDGELFVCQDEKWKPYSGNGYVMSLEQYANLLLGQKGTGFDAWSYAEHGATIKSSLGDGYWNITSGGATTALSEETLKACGGVCADLNELGKESVVVAAVLAETGGNASDWLGVCIEYTSDVDVVMMVRADSVSRNSPLETGASSYTIPASSEKRVENIPWGLFSPTASLKDVVGLEMLLRKGGQSAVTFNITKLGAYGTCG